MKKAIPNTVTLLNLSCGCIGIIFALSHKLEYAGYVIGIAAILDFLDGFLARILNAKSALGAQLDSFADAVSFGVLPGIILFQLLSISLGDYYTPFADRSIVNILIAMLGLLVPIFSVLRLAKFNLDDSQTYGFKGLPTPASAIFIGSLPVILSSYNFNFYYPLTGKILGATAKNLFWGRIKFFAVGTLQDTWFLVLVTLIISGLLVSSIPLLALKFKSKSWQDNKDKFIFLIIVLILITYTVLPYVFYIPKIPILDYLVIPIIILLYVVYSLLCPYFLDSKK